MKNTSAERTTGNLKANERGNAVMKTNFKAKSLRILAKDTFVNNNTWETGTNNNDLIVGLSGAGKTRGYVIPNIIHTAENLIVADTKGNLYNHYKKYLSKKGYKVMCLNFTEVAKTPFGYNPLDYIRPCDDKEHNENGDFYNEQDVKKAACAICPIQCDEPFWDLSAQMYLEMLILYVLNCLPDEQHNLYEVNKLLSLMETDAFHTVLEEEATTHPNSAFAIKYRMVRNNRTAEKMDASIKGMLAQHLDVVSYAATKRMFLMENQVDMSSFLKGKTALFLNNSDSDRSQDMLVNLFYTQALQYLMNEADKLPDSRLPIPVRFILDDFSTNTVIPDFDKIISVIRSREISVSLIIQSLSQLEGLYNGPKSQTIINNCDHCLYLGGVDVQTAKYFATKFNCQPSTILNLPLDCAYLFTRGSLPKKVTKFNPAEDETYNRLMEAAKPVPASGEPVLAD